MNLLFSAAGGFPLPGRHLQMDSRPGVSAVAPDSGCRNVPVEVEALHQSPVASVSTPVQSALLESNLLPVVRAFLLLFFCLFFKKFFFLLALDTNNSK